LFDKNKLHEIHKRLEDLETKSFVEQFPKMKDYEGTD
jgi:tetrahydromethanopterin S-methyltransferase subunit G